MTVKQFHGDLQIDEDVNFQLRTWRWQRVGWVVLTLALLAALAGAFGDGPLAKATVTTGRTSVDYPRVARYTAPMWFRVTLPVEGQKAWMSINNGYIDRVKIESIVPSPSSEIGATDETRFEFGGTGDTITVHVLAEPRHMGIARGRLRTADGEVAINMFVFP